MPLTPVEETRHGMLYQLRTRKKLQDVARDLEAAAQKHKFGVMGVYDLRAKMQEKGVTYDRDCLIYEVCNPQQAKKVLDKHPEISTVLPCRISLYASGAEVVVATVKPTAMIAVFHAQGLDETAQEVERTLATIMEEACR
jgi:uncharacterized protein (DUF302 family)